jgi:hypothetical protein
MNPLTLDGQTQIRGKCQYWRERMVDEDRFDCTLKAPAKRVKCTCFIEGTQWDTTVATLPAECPEALTCRYHVRSW